MGSKKLTILSGFARKIYPKVREFCRRRNSIGIVKIIALFLAVTLLSACTNQTFTSERESFTISFPSDYKIQHAPQIRTTKIFKNTDEIIIQPQVIPFDPALTTFTEKTNSRDQKIKIYYQTGANIAVLAAPWGENYEIHGKGKTWQKIWKNLHWIDNTSAKIRAQITKNFRKIIADDLPPAWHTAGIAILDNDTVVLLLRTTSGAQKILRFTYTTLDNKNFVFSEIPPQNKDEKLKN